MKMRTDFVTNSSSVSYIVTMDLSMVDCFIKNFQELETMKGTIRLAEAMRDYLLENGTVNYLHNHEIYSCLIEFNDDDGSSVTKEILEMNGDNSDPLKMNETDLFAYIKGELLQNKKLSNLLNGFGATQVEQY
jgi:hypothetical protein